MGDRIESNNQSGGITAKNVHYNERGEKKKPLFQKTLGILVAIATIVGTGFAALEYFKGEKIMGSTYITSNNQQGGITAHTINIGPQDRHINEDLKEQLLKSIPVGSTVRVGIVMGDQEAFQFATECLNFLKSKDYKATGVDQSVYSTPITGQLLEPRGNGHFDLIIGKKI